MDRRKFTKEFKDQAVKLVNEQSVTVMQAAKDLDIGHSTISRWVREARENGKNAFPGKGNLLPWDEEKRELEKRLRRAETERDILKKTIGYLSVVQ
jgi:transposase